MSTAGQPPHPATTASPVQVWMRGVFPPDTGDYARRMITAVLRRAAGVDQARASRWGVQVRLSTYRDPAVPFPVVAQVNLEFGDRPIRVQVSGATAREAIDLLQVRLRHQLDQHLAQAGSGSPPARAERQMPPNPRRVFFPRPPQTQQIVRRKPVRLALLGVDEAVREMERQDYYFHLFTEIGTRQDSVVYRTGPIGYRFTQVRPAPEQLAPYTVQLSCYDRPAPRLRIAEATEWLRMSEVPFLFFLDADRERGSVLYRRYDGHYGLLSPSAPQAPAPQAEPNGEAKDGGSDAGEHRDDHSGRGE